MPRDPALIEGIGIWFRVQEQHMSSAFRPIADVARFGRYGSELPRGDICSPSRFGFGTETDFRPALSEFAESPSGCQRRFGLLSLVRARFGLPGGRAGRQEAKTGRLRRLFGRSEGPVDNVFLFHGGQVVVDRLVDGLLERRTARGVGE
jgi:hypothetical protein